MRTFLKKCAYGIFLIQFFIAYCDGPQAHAELIPLTILHTNDIHSHYRPDKGPFKLGGIGRIATTVRTIRSSTPNTLLLDGGDWSEGHIYYNLDAGRTSIEIMNEIGYDAAALGNHDWLNGPDHLIKLFTQNPPKFSILAANLDFSDYPKATELKKYLEPYKILQVGGLKIGVIGLATYEFIYDPYFKPVGITYPINLTKKLAAKLKNEQGVDLVIVISHNTLETINRFLPKLPNVDIVIHAHDHRKYAQPLVFKKSDRNSYLVEADQWGFYLGKMDLLVDTKSKRFELQGYELLQMDEHIPEDPKIMRMVAQYERQLTERFGNIFNDHVAECKIDIRKENAESVYGNLLADAYRDYAKADVSFEQTSLTSGIVYKGVLNSADIFNALSAVFDPITNRAWTLKTMKMSGATIVKILDYVLRYAGYSVSVSGVRAIYDPSSASESPTLSIPENSNGVDATSDKEVLRVIKKFEINGDPVNWLKQYSVALPQGIFEAVKFIELRIGKKIEYTDFVETEVEDWKILREYLQKNSPFDGSKIPRGGRIIHQLSDLAMYHDEVKLESRTVVPNHGTKLEFLVTVRNMGASRSTTRRLFVSFDKTPRYIVDDPNLEVMPTEYYVPPVESGSSVVLKVAALVPPGPGFKNVDIPFHFGIENSTDDPETTNDGTWVLLDKDGSSLR